MKKIILMAFLAATVVIAWCANTQNVDESWYTTEQVQTLAQCLTDKGVVMYGTTRCPHCQNQKKRFWESADLITFIDCDENRIQCEAAGIKWFPTWITQDGQRYSGDQPLESLAQIGACEL